MPPSKSKMNLRQDCGRRPRRGPLPGPALLVLHALVALVMTLALACSGTTAKPKAKPRPAPRPAPPAAQPAPAPAPPPAPAPQPVTPITRPPGQVPQLPIAPVRVRVGLASDLPSVVVPCCEGAVTVSADGRSLAVVAPVRVEPAAASAEAGYYRLQVAALRDERQAGELARRLATQTGQEADAHFDAGIDLYRVRLGRYASREAAETASRQLAARGITGAFVQSARARASAGRRCASCSPARAARPTWCPAAGSPSIRRRRTRACASRASATAAASWSTSTTAAVST